MHTLKVAITVWLHITNFQLTISGIVKLIMIMAANDDDDHNHDHDHDNNLL